MPRARNAGQRRARPAAGNLVTAGSGALGGHLVRGRSARPGPAAQSANCPVKPPVTALFTAS